MSEVQLLGERGHDYSSAVPSSVRSEGSRLFNFYFDFLNQHARKVVVVWAALFVLGISTGLQFMQMSNDAVGNPPGTRYHSDVAAYSALFPNKAHQLPLIVLMQSLDGQDVSKSAELKNFSEGVIDSVRDYNATHPGYFVDVMGFYTYQGTALDNLKDTFLSTDHTVTFLSLIVNNKYPSKKRGAFIGHLESVVEDLNPDNTRYNIGVTGLDALGYSMIKHSLSQLEHTDGITIPIAMCLMGYMVGSWRFLAVAVYNMIGAITVAMSIMVLLVNMGIGRPDSVCAQLMQGMSLGLSIDYALFVFTRIIEEIKKGSSTQVALYRSMLHAGHVILMSGLTIMVVFLGFVALPAAQMKVDGVGCSVGVAVAIAVALTNTPALIILFPKFFSTFNGFCGKWAADYGVGAEPKEDTEMGQSSSYVPLSNEENGDDNREPVKHMSQTFRFKMTVWLTRWPNNLITLVVLYLCVIPLAWQVTRINITEDILTGIPRSSSEGEYLKLMTTEFSAGALSPFSIVIAAPENKTVMSKEFFDLAYLVSSRIRSETDCKTGSVTSPAFVNNKHLGLFEAEALLGLAELCGDHELREACSAAKEYEFLFHQSVNAAKTAMIITAMVPYFPFSKQSQPFIDQVYDIIDEIKEDKNWVRDWTGLFYVDSASEAEVGGGYNIYFCGAEVGNDTLMRIVFGSFPLMIGLTLASVFVLMGCMMKSVFVPVRLAMTLVLPLLAVYGLAILVYQDGILTWLSPATATSGGFYWFLPILTTSIICGLALDYDVFLITRIIEHRKGGYDIRAAVVKAVCETGTTIASAGVIMTLAFSGMLLSDQLTLDIGGFLLATAVMFDTFVVNTILVPALMSLGDGIAWWPTKMPVNNLKTLDHPEFTGVGLLSDITTEQSSTTYDSLISET